MATVDLGNGMSMKLRDDLSMGDLEKINRETYVYDARYGQWQDDKFAALMAMIEVGCRGMGHRSTRTANGRRVFASCR